ncbi:TetR/AcrR family transcriptional regulator [Cohnella nanjingensis]|uniref:TetR/AcrR family transcriptional regulator n=1 Tax=Cohnella nanjingensis TaxID=1387779 RepID=A0A7X0RR68_9BACL|nr:TetR/AcrR family transcriptional regulator [Cohnella nanjingensis]MBB6671983.1 TetR/AcrR family transcriptional regulator [Cohnella nanjingensis]
MNGFEKRASQIKEKITKATMDLLRTSEPKKIRIADISSAAQVSQVTIYNYFGNKDELIRAVFRDFFDNVIQDFEAYMNEGHSLKEQIQHIIGLEKTIYHDFPPGLIRELLAEDQELSRYLEERYRERAIPLTIRMLQEGKDSGEISEAVSIDHVLAFIQLYMNQYEFMLSMAQQSEDMDGFLEGMVHIFFYGICGKP